MRRKRRIAYQISRKEKRSKNWEGAMQAIEQAWAVDASAADNADGRSAS